MDDLRRSSWFLQPGIGSDIPLCQPALLDGRTESLDMFDKEDRLQMFNRGALEKFQLSGEMITDHIKPKLSFIYLEDPVPQYCCYVCRLPIRGRVITAMGQKFHPSCFVCSYCRRQFPNRKYKWEPKEGKPYCTACFDKLIGHFSSGSAKQG